MNDTAERIPLEGHAPANEALCLFFGSAEPEPPVDASRRKTLTMGGETKTLREWAEPTGIKLSTLKGRVNGRWTDEECLRPIRASHVARFTYRDPPGSRS